MDVQDFLFFGNFSPTEKENGTVITYPIELELPKVKEGFWTICDEKIILPTITPQELTTLLNLLQSNVITQLELLKLALIQAGHDTPVIVTTTHKQIREFEKTLKESGPY
ncbi:MAG TPA: hypothetical protein DCL21_04245 [Alphaproteobacteria bacterium]|nr:hypothetical protein [Alphaproteobacteria bacterium]